MCGLKSHLVKGDAYATVHKLVCRHVTFLHGFSISPTCLGDSPSAEVTSKLVCSSECASTKARPHSVCLSVYDALLKHGLGQ